MDEQIPQTSTSQPDALTASEFIAIFAKRAGITKSNATLFARAFQEEFQNALINDKSLKINKIGSFKLVEVEARKSVDINTGKEIEIAGHYKISFQPDPQMRDAVNAPLSHLETVDLDEEQRVSAEEEARINLANQANALLDIIAEIQNAPLESTSTSTQPIETQPVATPTTDTTAAEPQPASAPVPEETNEPQPETDDEQSLGGSSQRIAAATNEARKAFDDLQLQSAHATSQTATAENRPTTQEPSEYNQGKSSNSKLWTWIYSAIIAAVVIVICAVLIFIKKAPENDTPTGVPNVNAHTNVARSEDRPSPSAIETAPVQPEKIIEENIAKPEPIIEERSVFEQERTYTAFKANVTVKPNETLASIAQQHYGSKDFWVYIYEANKDVLRNPNKMVSGTTIRIPSLDPQLVDPESDEAIKFAKMLQEQYLK